MFKFYKIPNSKILDKLLGSKATVRITSTDSLNDPYELKFNLDIEPLSEEHEELYYKNNPGATKDDFLWWQKHAMEEKNYSWYLEQEQRMSISNLIGLCSFTAKKENNLMWSHYADNHKGICIEYKQTMFEYLSTIENFLMFNKVNYSDDPPTVNALDSLNLKFEKIMFNKQTEWKYENEHRVIFSKEPNKKNIDIEIDKKYIKAVYLGSRADRQIKKRVLTLCQESQIDFFYAITIGESYNVQFEKYREGIGSQRSFW